MPTFSLQTAILWLLLAASCLLTGCGGYCSLPENWYRDLPGLYEGVSDSFRETVEFKPDGTFNHEVFESGHQLLAESGKWNIPPRTCEVSLDHFTEYYNRQYRKFSRESSDYRSYYFHPLETSPRYNGKSFNIISADREYRFTLKRKTAATTAQTHDRVRWYQFFLKRNRSNPSRD